MKKFAFILLGFVIGAVFIGTLFYLYQKNQEPPIIYDTESAQISSIIKKTVATGSVIPRKEVEVKPQISGIIEKIYIKAGDQVTAGQTLARIKIIPDMLSMNNAESRLNKARIALDQSQQDFDRQKKLYIEEVISESDYQKFEVTLKNAKEELDASENNLQLIKEGVSKKSANATNTIIKSNVDGMILDVPVKEGNSVIESNTFNEGTTIASIANMNTLIFQGKVDESEVGKIKVGMPLILSIGAIENEKFDAVLEYISPKGIEENGAIQFEIRAAVSLKEDAFIRSGYSANADIVLDKKEDIMVVSESLLLFENDSVFVYIEKKNQVFEKQAINIGLSDGINIEVLNGLTLQDKIRSKERKNKEKNQG